MRPPVVCADAASGVAACRFASLLDTSTLGRHALMAATWDRNGNARTQVLTYEVTEAVVAGPVDRVRLRAVDPTPRAGTRATLVARVPSTVNGRYRIVVKRVGASSPLKVCDRARRCAVRPAKRSGQASYVAVLRSTGPKHRLVARSRPVTARWR